MIKFSCVSSIYNKLLGLKYLSLQNTIEKNQTLKLMIKK